MLLIHGYADSWRSFERVLRHLPNSIHALALSQRGHGDSNHPVSGYHSHDFVVDLAEFMNVLHLEAAVIAGGSSGGLVARRFAINHPERTMGLVLMGSPLTLRNKPGFLELWDSTISKLTDPIDLGFVREFAESTLAQPVPQTFLDTMIQENLKVPARVWRAAFKGLLEDDSFNELNKIKAPTLIIWGDQDAILPRSDQEKLASTIASSQLVVYPGNGHALYWEKPDRIASDIVAFIKDLGN